MKNGLFVDKYGNKWWYKDNKLHKENGPAVEYCDGNKYWYKEGELHREDGPAIEHPNTNRFWWYYDNKWIDCKSQNEFLRIIKLKMFW